MHDFSPSKSLYNSSPSHVSFLSFLFLRSVSMIDMRCEEDAILPHHSQVRHELMHNQYNMMKEEEDHWQDVSTLTHAYTHTHILIHFYTHIYTYSHFIIELHTHLHTHAFIQSYIYCLSVRT